MTADLSEVSCLEQGHPLYAVHFPLLAVLRFLITTTNLNHGKILPFYFAASLLLFAVRGGWAKRILPFAEGCSLVHLLDGVRARNETLSSEWQGEAWGKFLGKLIDRGCARIGG